MGAGKSSVARHLSELLGWRVEDTDRWVRREQGWRSIADIFTTHGEAFFRERETAALRSLQWHKRTIVATGGGIVLRPENCELLRTLGAVVLLTAGDEVLYERVSRNRSRPLLHTEDPRATLCALLRSREPLYRACADFVVDTSALTHAEVARRTLAGVREQFPDFALN
ncbi:MAG: shikimate kinase [Verrucomicrobia bacterium]|nr:shikimate kinase [Verrucomicrobiota bacterium]